jgi:small-conductance mechanosensitive channel
MMAQMFFRIIEIAFASYMVPALLLPAVWLAGLLLKRRVRLRPPAAEIESQWRLLSGLFLVWLALFLAVVAGAPLNRGGMAAIAVCWMVYAVTNLLLAWFMLRFTSTYALIPEGQVADRAFMRFLGIVIAQPLMTAAAFAVLNQVMGVAWNLQVPELPAIQEGI